MFFSRRAVPTVLVSLLLSACGGGGAGTQPATPAEQATAASGSGSAAGGTTPTVAIRLAIPTKSTASGKRQADYVSASTQSMSVSVNGGTAQNFNFTVNSGNCTGAVGAKVCTVNVAGVLGSDTFVIGLYDGTNGTGNLLAMQTITQALTNSPNSLALTLNGVVNSIAIAPTSGALTAGTSSALTFGASVMDAGGNVISSPGSWIDANGNVLTITLTDSDSSGATSLSTTTLTPSSTSSSLTYNGTTIFVPTIAASVSGGTIAGSNTSARLSVTQLVPNGSFALPAQSTNSHTCCSSPPTGWTLTGPFAPSGAGEYNGSDGSGDAFPLPSGFLQGAILQNSGTALSETLTGLLSGGTYTLNFYAANSGGGSNAGLQVLANGVDVSPANAASISSSYPVQAFVSQSFTAPGNGQVIIQFANQGNNANLNVTGVYLTQL